jgi:hypothetical protein
MLSSVSESELNRALNNWSNFQKSGMSPQIVALARDVYLSLSEAQMARSLTSSNIFANRAYASQKKLNKLLDAKPRNWLPSVFVGIFV